MKIKILAENLPESVLGKLLLTETTIRLNRLVTANLQVDPRILLGKPSVEVQPSVAENPRSLRVEISEVKAKNFAAAEIVQDEVLDYCLDLVTNQIPLGAQVGFTVVLDLQDEVEVPDGKKAKLLEKSMQTIGQSLEDLD